MVLRRKAHKFCPEFVIFDFDGTIGDTFQAGLEILNLLAEEFHFQKLEGLDIERARDMRTRELMKFLGIPARKLARISRRGTEELRTRIDQMQPLPGMPELLRSLHEMGFRMGIITSNSEENVKIFLRNHQLELFEFVRTSSKLMGKAREIRSARKALGLKKHQVLFVGDETRDIEACQKADICIAAATWGYNSPGALQSLAPDHLIHAPHEVLDILRNARGGGV